MAGRAGLLLRAALAQARLGVRQHAVVHAPRGRVPSPVRVLEARLVHRLQQQQPNAQIVYHTRRLLTHA